VYENLNLVVNSGVSLFAGVAANRAASAGYGESFDFPSAGFSSG
jgi:hypothetical protein